MLPQAEISTAGVIIAVSTAMAADLSMAFSYRKKSPEEQMSAHHRLYAGGVSLSTYPTATLLLRAASPRAGGNRTKG